MDYRSDDDDPSSAYSLPQLAVQHEPNFRCQHRNKSPQVSERQWIPAPPLFQEPISDVMNLYIQDLLMKKRAEIARESHWQRHSGIPPLWASTGDLYCASIAQTQEKEIVSYWGQQEKPESGLSKTCKAALQDGKGDESNCFKSAQWSRNGEHLITTSEDNGIRIFQIPKESDAPQGEEGKERDNYAFTLKPVSVIFEPEQIYSVAVSPRILAGDCGTSWLLSCTRDHPVKAISFTGRSLASYTIQNPQTERFLTPNALAFSHVNPHFVCGLEEQIVVFDLNHTREPLIEFHTKSETFLPMNQLDGLIMALAISPENGALAAGTNRSKIGIFEEPGAPPSAVFSLADPQTALRAGAGVTDLRYSSCGRYLYAAERKSDLVHVYDIRKWEVLKVLRGREATRSQRIGIDLVLWEGGENETVVGGGVDGCVRVWNISSDGEDPVKEWKGHDDPVTSIAAHPTDMKIATCSGQRNHSRLFEESGDESEAPLKVMDNSVKIWDFSIRQAVSVIAASA